MKQYTLKEVLELIDSKRGAGVRKKTTVRMVLVFDTDIIRTKSNLSIIESLMTVLREHGLKDEGVKVETEIENNPDWKL